MSIMKEAITERLHALQAEYEAGQKMIAELDARRAALTTTLLRIEGAIQVLRELTDGTSTAENGAIARPSGAPPEARLA